MFTVCHWRKIGSVLSAAMLEDYNISWQRIADKIFMLFGSYWIGRVRIYIYNLLENW